MPRLALALVLATLLGCGTSSTPPSPQPATATGAEAASAPAGPAPAAPPPAAPPPAGPPAAGHPRIDGPGFSVELPDGTVKADDRANYDDGQYVVDVGDSMMMALWHAGGVVGNPIAEQAMITATARSAGLPLTLRSTSDPQVHDDLPARTYDLSLDNFTIVITVIECGRRAVSLAVAGRDPGIVKALTRAVTSFRCTPDPAREPRPGAPPVEVAMPEDFTRLSTPEDELRIFRGNEGVSFLWAPVLEPGAYKAMFEASLLALGFDSVASVADPINGRAAWRAKGPRGQVALATIFPCGLRQVIAIYAGPSERRGRTWLASAHCPG